MGRLTAPTGKALAVAAYLLRTEVLLVPSALHRQAPSVPEIHCTKVLVIREDANRGVTL